MNVRFRTLCSGSSGNAAAIHDGATRLLIDCGVRAQYRCRDLLAPGAGEPPRLSAVVVSHLHGDHICYASLRVLEAMGVPVYVHRDNAPGLARHFRGRAFGGLDVRVFGDDPFRVGEFEIRAVPVTHAPRMTTHGFTVARKNRRGTARLALATDLMEWERIVEHFLDADLIHIEANHDSEMLRENPNPNSAYHLENRHTGRLLREVLRRGRRPARVVLGHLSAERNTPELALRTVRQLAEQAGGARADIRVAPRFVPSEEIVLGG